MPQVAYAHLWAALNHLCAYWMAVSYLAGCMALAKAFCRGMVVAAYMSLLHRMAAL